LKLAGGLTSKTEVVGFIRGREESWGSYLRLNWKVRRTKSNKSSTEILSRLNRGCWILKRTEAQLEKQGLRRGTRRNYVPGKD